MKRIRVTTILGTRPELIRLSEIIKRFDILFEHRLVHTGQNSDEKLSSVFLQELSIRDPDLSLNLPNDSIGKFFGGLFTSIEKEFESLMAGEERIRAIDKGEYFQIPLDTRSLDYQAFFSKGSLEGTTQGPYTSHNTQQLTVEATAKLVQQLPEFKSYSEAFLK